MEMFSAISDAGDTAEAIEQVVAQLQANFGHEPVDLVVVFASPDHMADYADLPADLLQQLPCKRLIGCSGGGIVGGGKEIEQQPALSVTAARLPDVELDIIRISNDAIPRDAAAWYERLGFEANAEPSFILLPDGFSFDVDDCIEGLDGAFPGAPIIGGLASGGIIPGGNAIFIDDASHSDGAALLALRGNIVVEPIIAQGCKPIGEPMLVTSCDGHIILQLGNERPGDVLGKLRQSLDDEDQDLMRNSLFMGVEMKDQVEYRAGDFLIRNIVGLHPEGSALAIAATLQQFQAVQFHLRDRHTSSEDLDRQLDRFANGERATAPAGALLFSCMGRGKALYESQDHDSRMFHDKLGPMALGGFFCNGEIGPVCGQTYLHGYTSAFAVFRAKA